MGVQTRSSNTASFRLNRLMRDGRSWPSRTLLSIAQIEHARRETMAVHIKYQTSTHGKNDPFQPLNVVWIDISEIKEAPRRVRKALEKQDKAVKQSIARFGNRIPILIDGKYHVIDGHARLGAARLCGAEKVPCIIVDDLPDHEVRRLRLSLNKLQETGAWDDNALHIEIKELIDLVDDFDIPGFELPEIEAITFGGDEVGEDDPADNLDDVAAPSEPIVSQLGDVWILGDHQIVCGSSRDSSSIAKCINGDVADAIFTDPPYNVKVNGHVRSNTSGF